MAKTQLQLLAELLDQMKLMRGEIAELKEAGDGKVGVTHTVEDDPADAGVRVVEPKPAPKVEEKYPIPSEYREVVDITLNKEFGIQVEPLPDKPAFNFTIIVPNHYSNATAEHIKLYGGDRRSRVITYADGTAGVTEWTKKVLDNLDPEAKAKISIAREQVKT